MSLHECNKYTVQSSFSPTNSMWLLLQYVPHSSLPQGTLLYLLLLAWHEQVCGSLMSWKYANSKLCAVAIPFPIFTVRVRHVINFLYTSISHVDLTNRVLK